MQGSVIEHRKPTVRHQVHEHKLMVERLKAASAQAALEQDAVALKLAAALQDTAAKLAVARERVCSSSKGLHECCTYIQPTCIHLSHVSFVGEYTPMERVMSQYL
jgi:hypothetical protein